jgi:hypothetical protein
MPVEELIKQLQALPPNTKVLTWRERDNGYYAVTLTDLGEATEYENGQYLRAKAGKVKFVTIL